MHIVHVIPSLDIGGAETNLCSLVEQSESRGFRHTVIAILPGGALRLRLERAGATVIELCGLRGAPGLLVLRQLGLSIAKASPDIVHSWMYHANAATAVLKSLNYFSCPSIWSIRQSVENPALDRRLTRAIRMFGAWMSDRPEAIVYNSTDAALTHEVRGYSTERRAVIPNGVDCNRFKPRPEARDALRSQLGLPPDAVLIGRVARYSLMKDFRSLIAAFRVVIRSLPSARLLLVGNKIDVKNDELVSLCRDSGIMDYVHLMGPRLDIEMVYPAIDVLVSSSSSNEGFPNVVAEGLASGNLVAATPSGEGSLLQGGAHAVVAAQDSNALGAAILNLASLAPEEKKMLSNRGRQFVMRCFSIGECVQTYRELYCRISPRHALDRCDQPLEHELAAPPSYADHCGN